MKITRRKISYVVPKRDSDFYEIADIQTALFGQAITSEEKYRHGFIEFSLTRKALMGIAKLKLVKIAVSKNSSNVFAFIAGIPYSISNRVGYLKGILDDVSAHFDYACFVHLCVQPSKIQNGIGSQLVRQLEFVAKEQNFQALIVPIPFGNDVAFSFFENRGFKHLHVPLVTDRLVLFKELR